MSIRGIRGATTVEADLPEQIIASTQELLTSIIQANPSFRLEDAASVIFTLTKDLSSVHPAKGARQIGWNSVPMICSMEIPVPGSLEKCIRVLIHWNTDLEQNAVKHVYLHGAAVLRPDLMNV